MLYVLALCVADFLLFSFLQQWHISLLLIYTVLRLLASKNDTVVLPAVIFILVEYLFIYKAVSICFFYLFALYVLIIWAKSVFNAKTLFFTFSCMSVVALGEVFVLKRALLGHIISLDSTLFVITLSLICTVLYSYLVGTLGSRTQLRLRS